MALGKNAEGHFYFSGAPDRIRIPPQANGISLRSTCGLRIRSHSVQRFTHRYLIVIPIEIHLEPLKISLNLEIR